MPGTSPERAAPTSEGSLRFASSSFTGYVEVEESGGIEVPKSMDEQSGTSLTGTLGIEFSPQIVSEGTN